MTEEHEPGTPLLLIISGPSGVGKTTITRAIGAAFEDAHISVSLTTRAKGPNEIEGVDYHFVDEDAFQRRLDEPGEAGLGAFLEHAGVYGRRYGTLREPVERGLREGRLVILEIDVQGARQVRARYPNTYAIFILPPSDDALLQRLRDRRRDPEDVIKRRFAAAQREMRDAHEGDTYDAFIVNDDLGHAIEEALRLVRQRRGAASSSTHRA
ncbi:MAG: guanylate kinase [Phycisphaerales bacterium]|nr:MAG: guanylate kinase [Phycisphaerales bacterium]